MNWTKSRLKSMQHPLWIAEHKTYRLFPLILLIAWAGLNLISNSAVVAENHTATEPGTTPLLRVGSVAEHGLFNKQGDNYSGFYFDLWDIIAGDLQLKYEWVVFETFADLRKAVAARQIDVGATHLSINAEREKVMDFTHVVFNDGFQLYVPSTGGSGRYSFFSLLYESGFFKVIGEALLVLLALSHVFWLAEKRHPDSDIRQGYLHGIEDAVWWSIVTVTTVGYGDKTPRSRLGRLIAVAWMLTSLFVVSIIVGQVTSMMTVANLEGSIKSIDDLPGKAVGVVADTNWDDFLKSIKIEPVHYKTSSELFEALSIGYLDVALSDIVTGLLLPDHIARKVKKAGSVFKRDNIALALPQGSPLRENINRALMTIIDDGRYDSIYDRWFSGHKP